MFFFSLLCPVYCVSLCVARRKPTTKAARAARLTTWPRSSWGPLQLLSASRPTTKTHPSEQLPPTTLNSTLTTHKPKGGRRKLTACFFFFLQLNTYRWFLFYSSSMLRTTPCFAHFLSMFVICLLYGSLCLTHHPACLTHHPAFLFVLGSCSPFCFRLLAFLSMLAVTLTLAGCSIKTYVLSIYLSTFFFIYIYTIGNF